MRIENILKDINIIDETFKRKVKFLKSFFARAKYLIKLESTQFKYMKSDSYERRIGNCLMRQKNIYAKRGYRQATATTYPLQR